MRFMVAGVQSGCGKTSVTLALMQALRVRGLAVAPFKAGPDFLDPMWHAAVCGRPSYNLDTRMMDEDHARALFASRSKAAGVSIVEGVMGLFDGADGVGGTGSSVHLARVLGIPVLLVVNAKGMSGSIAPLAAGFAERARRHGVTMAGVIANYVGSERHATLLAGLLEAEGLPPLVAWMGKDAPDLPERYLGLVMPDEVSLPDFSASFHLDEGFFTAEAQRDRSEVGDDMSAHVACSVSGRLRGKRIAVARDEAFCFIYPANLDWLRAEGAEIAFFSSLAGEPVPAAADALWLPGGYPELHLKRLSASPSLASIRDFIERGGPVLAECGGMMILGEAIDGMPMAGVLPCVFEMRDRLVALGYRVSSEGARGHEFHHSSRKPATEARRHGGMRAAFDVSRGDRGMSYKKLRASYIHWYFPGKPEEVASWFR